MELHIVAHTWYAVHLLLRAERLKKLLVCRRCTIGPQDLLHHFFHAIFLHRYVHNADLKDYACVVVNMTIYGAVVLPMLPSEAK